MSKAFEFRLESVLEIRRRMEEVAQREFAVIEKAVAGQNQVILRLMAEEDGVKKGLRAEQRQSIDVGRLRLAGGCLDALEQRLRRESETLQELVKAEIEKRQLLMEARKSVRVLERFREKQYRLYRQELDRQERGVLDEIGRNLARRA